MSNDSSKPAHIESFLDSMSPTLLAVDEVLNEWTGEGCLQFPTLFTTVASKLNWTDKQIRQNDPIIREFIRNHPHWHVTRGAHGGIMRTSDRQKKLDAEIAKKKAKEEMKAVLESKMKQAAAAVVAPAPANDSIDDSDLNIDE